VIRAVSYGGGVQSTALLVLAAEGRIDFPLFLFANTGDDSEHPATLAYVRDVAVPFAEDAGVELVELDRRRRDGTVETLRERIASGSLGIPVRRYAGGPPLARSCTVDFKVRVVGKELKRRGATTDNPALVGIGISVDEIQRAKEGVDDRAPWQRRTYPLLDLGMHRRDCAAVIAAAGLPVPPKSACFFCPFHDKEAWRKLRRETPDLFAKSCEMEAEMSASTKNGKPVFLTRSGLALADAIDEQEALPGMDSDCDSGWCMT
jgi:hypothetical protein